MIVRKMTSNNPCVMMVVGREDNEMAKKVAAKPAKKAKKKAKK